MKIKTRKNLFVLLILDSLLLIIAYFLSYMIRFEGTLAVAQLTTIKYTIFPILICKLTVFYYFNLYSGMWRYTSIVDLLNVIKSIAVSSLFVVTCILMYSSFKGFSRSVFIIDGILSLFFIAGIRLSIRMILSSSYAHATDSKSNQYTKLIIIGAGDAGEKVMREINDNPNMKYRVIGFLDDDKRKMGKSIHGVKIFGRVDQLGEIAQRETVDELLIATPSASGEKMRRIVNICDSINIPYKTLPGMGELIDGRVSIKTMRDISYKDLLGRPSVHLENDKILDMLQDKCVLVTGAGGSIGSELCRQICKYKPSLIIFFDASESNLYSIQMELKHEITYLKYRAVLGHVQDERLLDEVFKKYKPKTVFHAAAYKHVPLVERNPWEAIFSNIVGTNTIVKLSIKHNVERFVLVSSDKAVRPTNVMGATKRVAEKIIQSQIGETKFMAVRFGNVVGSSGSVIPLFRRQIEKGGPVTVTHPEITRYFMTIEEASQLILQSFTMGMGGEIFILEMGEPVKIVDMAKDLIRLSGKNPDGEIEIKFTGLRPGEKLYEELITEGEGIVKTGHQKILVLRNGFHDNEYNNTCVVKTSDYQCLNQKINELISITKQYKHLAIKQKLKEIVPEYVISDDEAVV